MSTYLITGALRGLGLALTKELLSKPASEVKMVITTGRKSNQTVEELASKYPDRVAFVQMELNESSVKQAAAQAEKIVGDAGLDVLINNAGVMPHTPDGVATMFVLFSLLALLLC